MFDDYEVVMEDSSDERVYSGPINSIVVPDVGERVFVNDEEYVAHDVTVNIDDEVLEVEVI